MRKKEPIHTRPKTRLTQEALRIVFYNTNRVPEAPAGTTNGHKITPNLGPKRAIKRKNEINATTKNKKPKTTPKNGSKKVVMHFDDRRKTSGEGFGEG